MTEFDLYAFADYSGSKHEYQQRKAIALSVIDNNKKNYTYVQKNEIICTKMTMKKPKSLQEFLKTAKQNHGGKIDKIILFGSYARGEATEESDIDILVITSENRFEMQRNLSDIAVDILLKTGEYISAKAVSTKEYSFMKKINTGFYQNIAKEGVVVG